MATKTKKPAKSSSKTGKAKSSGKSKVVKRSKEPTNMEELLASYGTTVKSLNRGDKINGTVVEKSGKSLILDIGWKSQGMVAEKAYDEAKDYIKTLKTGDEVVAQVIIPETSDGFTILSLRQSAAESVWKKLEDSYEKSEAVNARIKSVGGSGVMVEVMGMTGFIPGSHLGEKIRGDINNMIGQSIKAIVIELDREAKRIVLSERAISEAEDIADEKAAIKSIKENKIYNGMVTTVTDFGCFVSLKISKKGSKQKITIDGLVHISELSWQKVGRPSDVVKVGDEVKVMVVGKTGGKLSLSIKQATEDPWDTVEKKYKSDSKKKGTVARISDFGYFVELEPGVEGLLHMTKVPPGKRIKEGDKLNIYIEEVNKKDRRISLGLVLAAKPVGYK